MLGQKSVQLAELETLHDVFRAGIIKDWTAAVDGGAHVGTWTAVLAEKFERVIAFEPTPETFSMLVENMAGKENVESRNEALLHKAGRVNVLKPRPGRETLTARYVEFDKKGETRCVTVDSLKLRSCGLIKLDLEGAEWPALEGAKKTVARCRPVLVVEIWDLARRFGNEPEEVHKRILRLGYREVFRRGVDRIYAPH